MKIEVDTKQDSHETIRKAIDLLKSIVGESAYSNQSRDIFSGDSSYGQSTPSEPTQESSGGGVFGNLFGSPSSESTSSATEETSTEIPTEDKEDIVEIIPY